MYLYSVNLVLNTKIQDSPKLIAGINLEKSDFLTFGLGITCGVLSLVGLIAIFISINSQHAIEKCREIQWELMYLIQSEKDESFYSNIRTRIGKNLTMYSQLLSNSRITKFIISITVFTIICVASIWWHILFVLSKPLKIYVYNPMFYYLAAVTVILIFFIIIIVFLSNIRLVGGFDKPSYILNGKYKSQISTAELVAMSLVLRIAKVRDIKSGPINGQFMANLHLKLPFKNVDIASFIYINGKFTKTNIDFLQEQTFISGPRTYSLPVFADPDFSYDNTSENLHIGERFQQCSASPIFKIGKEDSIHFAFLLRDKVEKRKIIRVSFALHFGKELDEKSVSYLVPKNVSYQNILYPGDEDPKDGKMYKYKTIMLKNEDELKN